MATVSTYGIKFEDSIGQPRQQLWSKDGCEMGKRETNWKPVQTRSNKGEEEIRRMTKNRLTWKNQQAYVSHHLQPQWHRWVSGDTSILCYGAGDIHAPGLWLVVYRGIFSGNWGICWPGCYSRRTKKCSTSLTMCVSYHCACVLTSFRE